jgi:uncharacterized membrane protein YqjE
MTVVLAAGAVLVVLTSVAILWALLSSRNAWPARIVETTIERMSPKLRDGRSLPC